MAIYSFLWHMWINSSKSFVFFSNVEFGHSYNNSSREILFFERFIVPITINLSKDVFMTVNTILWKSDIPVSITLELWKLRWFFVRMRPMLLGFSGILVDASLFFWKKYFKKHVVWNLFWFFQRVYELIKIKIWRGSRL